jgi:hypothetical protein
MPGFCCGTLAYLNYFKYLDGTITFCAMIRRIFHISFAVVLLIIARVNKASAQHEFMATIDPASGVIQKFDSVPGVMYISPHAVIDDHNKRFLFIGMPPDMSTSSLYTVDAVTGKLRSKTLLPKTPILISMKYNDQNDQLYGMVLSSGVYSLVSIDPIAGVYTNIRTINAISSMNDQMLIDNNQHLLINCVGSGGKFTLVTIDLGGNLVSTFVIPNINGLQYDPVSSSLYGLSYSNGRNQLLQVNPSNGVTTSIGMLPADFAGAIQYSHTFDKNKRHYILGSGSRIMSIDVNTAAVIYDPVAPVSSNAVDKDNVINFRYSNALQKVYALHWNSKSSTVATVNPVAACTSAANFKVFYNRPGNTIVVNKAPTACIVRMSLSTELGQVLIPGQLIADGTNIIKMPAVVTGTYFIRFYSGNALLRGEKIFISR